MTPREILIAARAKIEAPERWTKGAFARSARGRKVRLDGGKARCWCMLGALQEVEMSPIRFRQAWALLVPAISVPDSISEVVLWNDAPERTHAEVLAAFDRAIELAGDA